MKKLLFAPFCLLLFSFSIWQPDFVTAKKLAKEKHQLILLNFSGSDWCGPCIRMHKEILESTVFSNMSDTTLILINADFPRNKKNQPGKDKQKQNDMLAETYNPDGKFPFTILLNGDGKVIKTWDGFPKENAIEFTKEVKAICDANK